MLRDQSRRRPTKKALIALYENGVRFRTQYDKPGDPLSLDCTMNITVLDPLAEPMIHKAFPGGIEDLREYVHGSPGREGPLGQEHERPGGHALGIHLPRPPRRLRQSGGNSATASPANVGPFNVDQVEAVIAKLVEQPFTRQAQMITWMPNIDLDCYDPPCLQSLWYRILEDDDGSVRGSTATSASAATTPGARAS